MTMKTLVGTGHMVRLALRRDRIMLPVWIVLLAFTAGSSAAATVGLYPTLGPRVAAAETVNRTQSLVALYGRIYDTTSVGAIAMVKLGGIGAILVAVLAILILVRHTRAEEETGRLELVGSTVLGRHAPLTAALLVVIGTNLVLALVTALALISAGLPVDGSFAFGLAWAGVGISFAAITAVTVQLSGSARSATGLAVAVLGVVYLLRATGDASSAAGPRWLTWLSPIGWSQQFRPYAGNRWWVLLITIGFAAVTAVAAYVLVGRRDMGSGLLPERLGPATAAPGLGNALALAWRLQRGTLFAWVAGFALLGLVFGSVASTVGELLDSPQARDMITKLGGQKGLVDAFLAAELGFIGVAASAYGVQAAMRLRAEEIAMRAEPLLATATSRIGWALSHITVALAGTSALMLTAGIFAGGAHAAQVVDVTEAGRVIGAALVQLPAAWVLTGIVVATFGLAPRMATAGWAALVGFLLLGELGPVFELDQWVMDISPFAHTPRLPGGDLSFTPIVMLTAVTILLIGAGLAGFRRRDIG